METKTQFTDWFAQTMQMRGVGGNGVLAAAGVLGLRAESA